MVTKIYDLPEGAVDCHAHVIKCGVPLDPLHHSAPARDATVEEYLEVLRAYGVSYGVLTAPSFYGNDNTLLLEALKESGGVLRGTAIVDPSLSEEALSDLQNAGVCGLRFNWTKRDNRPDITSEDYRSLLSKAANLGLHIEVYVEGEFLPEILREINRSGAQAVVDHFGHPDGGRNSMQSSGFIALLSAIDAGSTWVKLSAPYRLRGAYATELAAQIISRQNGERALWGSDWPWISHENEITYAQCVSWLFDWATNSITRARILVENPQSLFGFSG